MTDNTRLFALRNNIIVLKDVCRSKKSHESVSGLTSSGTKSCFKIDGPSENKKKGGRPITNFENPQF